MGLLSRLRYATQPRRWGSGKVWDNTNTPGGKGWSAPPKVATQIPQNPNNYVRGLNPNSPIALAQGVNNPELLYTQIDILQPIVPWRAPRGPVGTSGTYTQSTPGTPGQPPQPPTGQRIPIVTSAPPTTQEREVDWDTGNPVTHRIPDGASQQYFNQLVPVQEFHIPFIPAHAVQTPELTMKRGWYQELVPEPGMSANAIGQAPPYYLSKPLNVRTVYNQDTVHRAPIKATAPKRKRTV